LPHGHKFDRLSALAYGFALGDGALNVFLEDHRRLMAQLLRAHRQVLGEYRHIDARLVKLEACLR
jgi:hypothetical protein